MMTESELIQSALDGNLEAFNELILRYQDIAFNLAYRIMGDEASAADATQEAVIAMYRKLNSYRGGSFKSWFLRIVSNQCLDELRRNKRRPTTSLNAENDEGDACNSDEWLAEDAPSQEERMSNAEINSALRHCLNHLDPKFKSILVMVDISGENYESVAQIVQVPVGTVKSRLARARQKMQECLRSFGELLPEKFRLKGEC